MRIFAGPWVKSILERLGMKEGERIESRMVTRRIEAAQKKVEERNFEIRKNLLEYDEVMDEQRKRVYRYRQQILDGVSCRDLIVDMIRDQVEYYIDMFLDRDYGVDTFAKWAGNRLSTTLDATRLSRHGLRSRRKSTPRNRPNGWPRRRCSTPSKRTCPIEEDASEWNWEALAKMADTRWGLNLRDRDLKKVGRDDVAELLIEKAREAIHRVDLSEGAPFLEEDFALRTTVGWVKAKFGIDLDVDRDPRSRTRTAQAIHLRTGRKEIRRERSRISGDGRSLPVRDRRRTMPASIAPHWSIGRVNGSRSS